MPLPIHVFSYKNVNNVNKGLGKVKPLPRQPHAGRANRKALGKPVQIRATCGLLLRLQCLQGRWVDHKGCRARRSDQTRRSHGRGTLPP